MGRRESRSDARAQLDLEQRVDAYRVNRNSRVITQALRIVAGIAGFTLLIVACVALLISGARHTGLDARLAEAAAVGAGLFAAALRANPPDLRPSTTDLDVPEGDDEQASASSDASARDLIGRVTHFLHRLGR